MSSSFLTSTSVLRLGDAVRAYNTPEGTCVVLGDFLTALDVPMRIDLGARKASGWAFKENNRISIDYGTGMSLSPAKPRLWRRPETRLRTWAGH